MSNACNPPDVVDLFLSAAQYRPDMPAVDDRREVATYADFSRRAHQFAENIRGASSKPSPRVLLALPRSSSAYAAMVGSLIAGGTFCPVSLDGPEERNAAICRTFRPDIIFYLETPPPFLDSLPLTTRRINVIRLHTFGLSAPAVERSDVAYVVFTSGSTGAPKGVKVGRRGFSHFLQVAQGYFNLTQGERWAQFSNLGHDLGVMDVFMALTQRGTLVPLNKAECLRPATAIRDRRLSVWQSVPSVLELMRRAKQLTAAHLAPLRVMSFCGEPLYAHQLKALFEANPTLHVYNTYGTTETTGFNTINQLTAGSYLDSCDADAVAIGADVPGSTIHLRGVTDASTWSEIAVASEYLSLENCTMKTAREQHSAKSTSVAKAHNGRTLQPIREFAEIPRCTAWAARTDKSKSEVSA